MNQKLSSLLTPRYGDYFICPLLFVAATALMKHYFLALGELAVLVLFFVVSQRSSTQRRREAEHYLEKLVGSVDLAAKDTMLNCPMPVVMFQPETDEMVWSNDKFLEVIGTRDHMFDTRLSAALPGFDTRWLMEGKDRCPTEVAVGDRRFRVYGHMARTRERSGHGGFLATTYWLDVTEHSHIKATFQATRPVAALLLLDNYEDTLKGIDENLRARILSQIIGEFNNWVQGTGGMFCRLERDRYLYIFEEKHLKTFTADKFSILDKIHAIVSPSGIPVTLSIGVGMDADDYDQLLQYASLSLDMALSRGGDQAVVKNRFTFEFYGGRNKETEKRTKVKSRVMASALGRLVADASGIYIMGHTFPDMDCIGAAAGVCAIARKKGVKAYVIQEPGQNPASGMTERLQQLPEYKDVFLSAQDAMVRLDTRSLLVVVDTNRPEQVQSMALLESCNKVAVIDHHRRAATYIEGAALNFHEPYASSASELVAELIGYLMEPADLLKGEAEALMAGIMLDTKNFTSRTGGRTFEAAAFLRRSGADTGEVKKYFQNNLEETLARYEILRSARMYRETIAIAPTIQPVDRVTVAKASDELLNVAGINTSFVLCPAGDQVVVSGRSACSTNVQVILEALGGGGNAAVAGAQVQGKTVEQVTEELIEAIDNYFATEAES